MFARVKTYFITPEGNVKHIGHDHFPVGFPAQQCQELPFVHQPQCVPIQCYYYYTNTLFCDNVPTKLNKCYSFLYGESQQCCTECCTGTSGNPYDNIMAAYYGSRAIFCMLCCAVSLLHIQADKCWLVAMETLFWWSTMSHRMLCLGNIMGS